jgi:RNA binding exosome subunit
LYRQGKLSRSPFKLIQGYIYSLPEHKDKIVEKLKEIIPPYVKNAVEIVLTQKKIFTLNYLVETTKGTYETMEYYLDNVFCKQLNWLSYGYHGSYKIYWNSKYSRQELEKEFLKELSELHKEIKVKSKDFEKTVEKLLDSYLFSLPLKVEKDSTGTPSGKYFDLSYKIYFFDIPVHLKVEVKSYIPNLYQVALFYKKIREFKYGTIIPVLVAPAFPSVVYQTFGDTIYLVPLRKLEEIVKVIISTKVTR